METGHFDYPLPPARIAQFPVAERTASRLLAVPSGGAGRSDEAPDKNPPAVLKFGEIGALLRPGDVLVANDTRVVPARLLARKPTGGKVEILLERILGDDTALVQLRANKPIRAPQVLLAGASKLLVSGRRDGFFVIQCNHDPASLFRSQGTVPLPPYIERAAEEADFERYQTVYSRAEGAVAAPTAGLHFDRALIDQLIRAGIHWVTVTLHVGAGTFQPIRTESPAAHSMHREWVEVDRRACAQINRAKSRGGRVVAVGTTVVRALESAAQSDRVEQPGRADQLQPFSGDTELFILPGYRFRAVDALITNFHLPRSTLLMLVCAFAGYEKTMQAYRYAIAHDFRFYSYGDAMFVQRESGG